MMHFKQILVVKETFHKGRVALTPQIVATLVNLGYRVLVETDAGLEAGFSNEKYITAGASIFTLTSAGIPANTFIVRVLRPSQERELLENELFHENTAMLGFLFPFIADDHIAAWQKLGLTTLSFDLFKGSVNDPKNAQAAMSRIAGRLAFLDAVKHYQGNKPLKLTVMGTGAAAMSAAHEALNHAVPVQMFGRKESYRTESEAAGITYHVLPDTEQIHFIRSHLPDETLVITAARTPGKKAPLLIDTISLNILPAHAVVVDLVISNGGNVTGSKHDQIITLAKGVMLMNVSGYPKTEPASSSEIYAQCVLNVLIEIMSPAGDVSFENPLVQEIWVTHARKRHESLYQAFEI